MILCNVETVKLRPNVALYFFSNAVTESAVFASCKNVLCIFSWIGHVNCPGGVGRRTASVVKVSKHFARRAQVTLPVVRFSTCMLHLYVTRDGMSVLVSVSRRG